MRVDLADRALLLATRLRMQAEEVRQLGLDAHALDHTAAPEVRNHGALVRSCAAMLGALSTTLTDRAAHLDRAAHQLSHVRGDHTG